ncbi:MAG: ABC transporter substrate-binding protein [Burkholderiales bacterium]|nr:ABC transporter substrate-binding protein [Burkholderiales bacterium]
MTSHPILRRSLLGLALAAAALGVQAQGDKPIRLLVGFPPGGASDSVARVLAEKLQVLLKQQVIVENRPGVGGRIAAQAVKNAAPDGLTYMVAPNATFVFQHLTYPVSVLGYDMTTDFTSVAQINSYPMAMVVSAGVGVKTAKEYVAWLKANPDKGTFGTAGQGGDTHFNGLQFAKVAGVKMTVVPYRGNGPLVTDLVGGQILTGNMVAGDALQHVKSGKLTYIGVFAPKRSPLLPDVPTLAEQGFDTGGDNGWMGLWGPARLPKAELERMQGALKHVLAQPEVKELMMNRLAQVADYRSGEEADRQLKAELAHWGPVIKASGFTPAQ